MDLGKVRVPQLAFTHREAYASDHEPDLGMGAHDCVEADLAIGRASVARSG
jgi:hypothetical protein